mmetsp:Transcript_32457/g.88059  ORF Transcript_32457/g.88059 Transcript_32457/m.88059 type:complete len:305 (-) Transcript_32457:60-974(-)
MAIFKRTTTQAGSASITHRCSPPMAFTTLILIGSGLCSCGKHARIIARAANPIAAGTDKANSGTEKEIARLMPAIEARHPNAIWSMFVPGPCKAVHTKCAPTRSTIPSMTSEAMPPMAPNTYALSRCSWWKPQDMSKTVTEEAIVNALLIMVILSIVLHRPRSGMFHNNFIKPMGMFQPPRKNRSMPKTPAPNSSRRSQVCLSLTSVSAGKVPGWGPRRAITGAVTGAPPTAAVIARLSFPWPSRPLACSSTVAGASCRRLTNSAASTPAEASAPAAATPARSSSGHFCGRQPTIVGGPGRVAR